MVLIVKLEKSDYAPKFTKKLITKNLQNKNISNIVVFTDTLYKSSNDKIIVIESLPSDRECVIKSKSIFPRQMFIWSNVNNLVSGNLSKYELLGNDSSFVMMKDGLVNFAIFDPNFFNTKYNTISDCLSKKRIDVSSEKLCQEFSIYFKKETQSIEAPSVRVSGTKYTTPPEIVDISKIDLVIVSVDYNDFLVLTLKNNLKYFSRITVVTSTSDVKCQQICESLNVKCVVTDKMYEGGDSFNKGKAINEGIKSLSEPDWILILDADIIITKKLDILKLERKTVYTSDRWICENYETFKKWEEGEISIEEVGKYEEDRGFGFFQLFNYKYLNIKGNKVYSESYENAASSDIRFLEMFDRKENITSSIHLGSVRSNWRGRKTEQFIFDNIIDSLLNEAFYDNISDNNVLKKSNRGIKKSEKLAIITTFFNPNNYINIKYNFLKFEKGISKYDNCELFPIELSFDGNFFIDHKNVIRISGRECNIMWQKEKLLNIVLDSIPKDYINIAWIDCDILFENENWHNEVKEKLQFYKVLQLYQKAKRLDRNNQVERISEGIINRINNIQQIDLNLSKGIPGFGWAIRREIIEEIGFLDTQIIGGADSLMFYSFFGKTDGIVSKQMNSKWYSSFDKWSKKCYELVDNSVNFISGTIIHLYHGQVTNRKYNDRYEILNNFDFNPSVDLVEDDNRIWKLKNPKITNELKRYFEGRDEDDNIIDINNYFDKIFVINLDRRGDKMKNIDTKLKKLEIQYERFSAIDGKEFEFDSSKFVLGKGMIENKFALGCLMSHLEVVKIAKEKNYKRILIFEDDALISENINILIQKVRNKNWKLLYLGGSQYNWNVEFTEGEFYYIKKTLGTFAYAVDSSIYDDIIELLEKKYKSVDNILSDLQEKYYGDCLTLYPNICIADVSESEIREGRDNNKHSVIMRWNLLNNYM